MLATPVANIPSRGGVAILGTTILGTRNLIHYNACCVSRNMRYNAIMIKSFKQKGLQLFFEKGNIAKINAAHQSKLKMRLVIRHS